ncbi:exodeoxyribonuclease VII large subunit [Halobaculum magnesiiphilum]|uniref:exodeoxyribonuclease VII large subunit n=1 Tax=Halobaculum magnesiiphilum TaxID=1017351 RepID=UPI001CEC9D14|nr:exodeoxyribonuclease VII large subunit [Halobaculum magnesiiphilum]
MADAPDTERQAVEPDAREVLSVSQLKDRIASVVQDTPALNGVRCIGEVTDLHKNSTALYFTLTDGEAELPCMIWANRYREMDADLEDGTEVILEGDIDYWVEGGKIDLKPWGVIVVGDGDQAAAVERLRSELEERGWFDDEQKQQPPAFPERVGVVTSLRGDARYDIQNAIHGQDPTVDILVKDATVQGSNAPTSIANGVHHLDRSEDVDAIIVSRGGGSDSNLQAFNTERVAEAIFTANTPVVTAIGHTDDRLIADQVADVAAITPTAAGEYIVNVYLPRCPNSALNALRYSESESTQSTIKPKWNPIPPRRRVRNTDTGAKSRVHGPRSPPPPHLPALWRRSSRT